MRKMGNPQQCCCDCLTLENHLCVSAWSIGAYCRLKDATPDPCEDPANVVGALEGATVTINRVWNHVIDPVLKTSEDIYEPFGDPTETDATGKVCVDLPMTIVTPEDTPTVDPIGGGTSGGSLAIGTYRAAISHLNHYGETLIGPPSAEFQCGVPDPIAYPAASAILVDDTGDRTGALPIGVYTIQHTYIDETGETKSGLSAIVNVGYPNPTSVFTIVALGGGGSLESGIYRVAWAITDGAHFTTPIEIDPIDVTFGDVVGLTGVVPIPSPATGVSVWLSNDDGATWVRYIHDVMPGEYGDTEGVFVPFLAAYGGPVGMPDDNTFPVFDPRVMLPDFAMRPNAIGANLYIADAVNDPTVFRLYMTEIVDPMFDLLDAITGDPAVIPAANTTAKTVPRVTFERGPDYADRIYMLHMPIPGIEADTIDVITSPADADAPFVRRGIPIRNSSGWGRYQITVAPIESNMQIGEIVVSGKCNTFSTGFGFCAMKTTITVASGADTIECHHINACTNGDDVKLVFPLPEFPDYAVQQSGAYGDNPFVIGPDGTSNVVGLCERGLPCLMGAYQEYNFCSSIGVVENPQVLANCIIKKEGYYDRHICYHMECDVPAVLTEVATTLYSKADYLDAPCIEAYCEQYAIRDRSKIPKVLNVGFTGPKGMTGSDGEIVKVVTYNPALTLADGTYIYESECFVSNGWGLCSAPYRYQYLVKNIDPYSPEPCMVLGTIGTDYKAKRYYGSAKIIFRLCGPAPDRMPTTPGQQYYATSGVTFHNYWNGSCNEDDPPPYCGWDVYRGNFGGIDTYDPVNASPVMKLCIPVGECGAGLVPIGAFDESLVDAQGSIFNYFNTYRADLNVFNRAESGPIRSVYGPVDAIGESYSSINVGPGEFMYYECGPDGVAVPVSMGFSARVWE